jgi:hypothetical protein
MKYEPGQKVKVKVNGVEWKDEIFGKVWDETIETDSTTRIKWEERFKLKSGICVSVSMISPVETEIKPEPGDIVSVWDDDDEGEPEYPWLRMFEEIKDGEYGVRDGGGEDQIEYWSHARVIARKPRRWEEMTPKGQDDFKSFLRTLLYTDDPHSEVIAFNEAISLILGGVPYARIDK